MFEAIKRKFIMVSIILTIALILFCVLELLAGTFFRHFDELIIESAYHKPRILLKYPEGKVASISSKVIDPVIDEQYGPKSGAQMLFFPYTLLQGPSSYHSPALNTNRQGFRDEEFEQIIRDPRKKVILLGGSGMWGAGATSDKTTTAGYLQSLFDSNNVKLRVVNLAQPGFQSMQELITFERIGLRLQPEYVVIMDGGNDINHAMWQPSEGIPAYYLEMETILNRAKVSNKSPIYAVSSSLRTIQILKKILRRIDIRPVEQAAMLCHRRTTMFETSTIPEIRQEIAEQYRLNIRSIIQLAKANNVKPILLLQPSVCTIKPSNELEKTLGTPKIFADTYVLLSKAHKELAREYGVIEFDGGAIFNSDNSKKTKICDEFHYTDYGNYLIAEWIFKTIMKESNL